MPKKRANTNQKTTNPFRLIDINNIIPSSYNPASRTTKKEVSGLVGTIKEISEIIVPLIVKESNIRNKFELIEGHRRLASIKLYNDLEDTIEKNKIKKVWAKIYPRNCNKDRIFRIVNNTQKKLQGKQSLETIQQGGITALSEKEQKKFSDLKAMTTFRNNIELANKLLEKKTSTGTVKGIVTGMHEKADTISKKRIFNYVMEHEKLTKVRDKYPKIHDARLKNMIRNNQLINTNN